MPNDTLLDDYFNEIFDDLKFIKRKINSNVFLERKRHEIREKTRYKEKTST